MHNTTVWYMTARGLARFAARHGEHSPSKAFSLDRETYPWAFEGNSTEVWIAYMGAYLDELKATINTSVAHEV